MQLDLPEHGKSSPLPPYRALLAVDMENFSRTGDRNQQFIGELIPKVLEAALSDSGMEQVWKEKLFARHGGDGFVFGTDPEHLPFLISPFLENLQKQLEAIQPTLAALDRELRMRFRVSIDVGPLPYHGPDDPKNAMGRAMIDLHRRLDSEEVKAELKRTDPDATLVATVISRRVYEDVVLGGFTPLTPTRWRAVKTTVPDKGFQAESYLFLPVHTWGPDPDEGPGEVGDTRGPDSDGGGPGNTPTAPHKDLVPGGGIGNSVGYNDHGQVVQAGHLHGGVSFGGGASHDG
ncbi:hypothetical protein [Nocardiopsis alkaliphila]|uniref:hypothetical protein n=1 Tax=Nocardiopsis alkaliphila TaxID=225762 RepID=UPI0003481A28|nr:hypothetical protein [Nocardiopsis alkaliphila]